MNKLVLFFVFFTLLYSCSENSFEEPISEYPNVDISNMEEGHIRVKITEAFSVNIEQQADRQGRVVSTNVKSSDDILSSLGMEYMQRVFPPAGRFEARTRREGLHLWYDVYFDNNTPLTKARGDISELEGISYIEYVPVLVPIRSELREVIDVNNVAKHQATTQNAPFFNDPLFPDQWHYHNDGSRPMSIIGSDINVLPVWEQYTTGNSGIIVAIVDGGVDIEHEDLKDNIWINEAELNGVAGVDDDDNGYVDDVYGWDFVYDSPSIVPDDHGTHVAGIVGAVSNNGIGVSGVAGGNADKEIEGVKLMPCQIFVGNDSGSGIQAIKYSADAGAIISQNSWEYADAKFTPKALMDAVDYFIKFAGVDENGNQVGPMKGGIVIFAAGNANLGMGYPAEYRNVIAVSAIDAGFEKSSYSNYGDWVDITAPGGASEDDNNIISTLPFNRYGGMQGTSMSCPHVSGVAALLISHLGGTGFTSDALWDRLLLTTNDIIYKYNNPFIGSGLLDAYASFFPFSSFPPNKIMDIGYSIVSNRLDIEYSIPLDSDSDRLRKTRIYYSKDKDTLTRENIDRFSDAIFSEKYEILSYNAGDKFKCRILNLDFDTKYYIAVDAEDLSGNKSQLSDIIEVSVGKNNPPEVVATHGDLLLDIKDKVFEIDMNRYFYDIDLEELNYSIISSNQDLFTTEIEDDLITFTFTKVGSSDIKIVATDSFGGAAFIAFKMLIRDAGQDIDIYPNPVLDILNLRMGKEQDAIISIFGASGSILLRKEISISPFSPVQIDLTGFDSGRYIIVVNYDDKEIRRTIVKL